MTHDVDALVKRSEAHAVDIEQCSIFVDSTPLKRSMTDAAEFLREAATALQAEHEARVKAEGERDEARSSWKDATEGWDLSIAQTEAAVALYREASARATAAEAQLASAREALEKIVSLREFGSCRTSVEAEMKNTAEEALRLIPAPSPQNIGQGLSEKGQNVSESENAAVPAHEGWRYGEMIYRALYEHQGGLWRAVSDRDKETVWYAAGYRLQAAITARHELP